MKLVVWFLVLIGSQAYALPGNVPDELLASHIRFEFSSQEGDLNYPCTHVKNAALQDWEVVCEEPGNAASRHRFLVHLRLKSYLRPTAPKLSYELLYWVTDYQVPAGQNGHSAGTTMWFRLNEPSDLRTLEVGQDVEESFVLRTLIDLNQ